MRCVKCILSDKTPGISFDENSVCNYCNDNFPNYMPKGKDRLRAILKNLNIPKESKADCLVGLSGGKDSTHTLIKLKEEYGMKVEAFTYVHDGTVGFSVENAKNVCKELRVKHHIVSLRNSRHLKIFKGFFSAWIKSPSVTTAGMMCVACKHLHLLGYEIAKERKIPSIVWSTSPLEYSPFLALKHQGDGVNQFSRESNSKGAKLLLKEMVSSIDFPLTFMKHFDTCFKGCLAAFPTSTYLAKKYSTIQPIMFYDFENWNPTEIKTFLKNFNWNVPKDIHDDWHSDCLFNTFKEYVFQSDLGVSYTDAFLSNQVRYGLLKRDEALEDLLTSKKYFSKKIYEALDILEMNNLKEKIDTSCFKIEI